MPKTITSIEIRTATGRVVSQSYVEIAKPGARYVVRRRGEEYAGCWVADDEAIPRGYSERFTEAEARLLLPLLRARAAAGRAAREATTPDGRIVVRAKKTLGLTAAGLAEAIGVHESVLSRALHGSLTDDQRGAIRDLIRTKRR